MKQIHIKYLNYIIVFFLSVPTLTAQIAADSQMYSIRYKGIRCNKSQNKNGDKISVYVVGSAANVRRNGAVNVAVDSSVQSEHDKIKTGMIYPSNVPVFIGTMQQEANILGAVLVYDQSGKMIAKMTDGLKHIKSVVPTVVNVHKVFGGNPPIAQLSPDSIHTFSTVGTPDITQLKIESTSNVGDQITAYLNSKEVEHEMIDKKMRPLEKKHLRAYLNAIAMTYKKEDDEISYHFSIRIKNDKADYELFFDVNKEKQ